MQTITEEGELTGGDVAMDDGAAAQWTAPLTVTGEEIDLSPASPLTGDLTADQILAAHLAGNPAPSDPHDTADLSHANRLAVLEAKIHDVMTRLENAFPGKW